MSRWSISRGGRARPASSTRFRPRSAALLLVAALASLGAGDAGKSGFWGKVANPGYKRYIAAMKQGRALFKQATRQIKRGRDASALLARTLATFRQAIKASPQEAQGHLWLGKTLYQAGKLRPAVAAMRHARKRDPALRKNGQLAFELGVALSKLGRYEAALREYDLAERLYGNPSRVHLSRYRYRHRYRYHYRHRYRYRRNRSQVQGNAAELLMALGRLAEAIERYRASVATYSYNRIARWGLAVALDRDAQASKALAAINRAVSRDRGMHALSGSGAFFIPATDVHYYRALGHLALNRPAQAKASFGEFLRAAPTSQWAFRARAHLARLARGAPKQAKKLAPRPGAGPQGDPLRRDLANIRHRVRGRYYTLQRCYRAALRRDRKLTGTLVVRLTVSKKGKLAKAKVKTGTIRNRTFRKCVLDGIRHASFPAPSSKKRLVTTVNLRFKPR